MQADFEMRHDIFFAIMRYKIR